VTNPIRTKRIQQSIGVTALAAIALTGCGTSALPANESTGGGSNTIQTLAAPVRYDYVLTAKITTADTKVSLEKLYSGKMISFRPDLGTAVLGLNTSTVTNKTNVLAIEANKNKIRPPETSATAKGAGWTAWSGGWTSWSGGWTSWSGGTGTSLTPTENTTLWNKIRLPQAQTLGNKGGLGVVVAVIDTGIDLTHTAFAGHLVSTTDMYDWIDGDTVPQDVSGGTNEGYGHGTAVAGIALQVAQKITIMPLRVLDPSGYGDVTNVIAAIDWAVTHGAQVINLSLGATYSKALDNAIQGASAKGVFVIASSGNTGNQNVTYPASGTEAVNTWGIYSVGVGSVNSSDTRSVFSTYGTNLEMVAPGENVYTTAPGGLLAAWSGTSMAAPMVTGGMALGQRAYTTVKNMALDMVATADNVDALNSTLSGGSLGTGRLNLEKFMTKVLAY
jgi:thermitase